MARTKCVILLEGLTLHCVEVCCFAAGRGSGNQNGNSSCNGGDRYQHRRNGYYPRFRAGAPNWSFVFDPAGRLCYYWSMVVSLAFLYNFWVIIYRFAFQEINGQ
jgi:hypothetical protein